MQRLCEANSAALPEHSPLIVFPANTSPFGHTFCKQRAPVVTIGCCKKQLDIQQSRPLIAWPVHLTHSTALTRRRADIP